MKNCANCGNQRTIWCRDCKTGNPPTMWVPEKIKKSEENMCKSETK